MDKKKAEVSDFLNEKRFRKSIKRSGKKKENRPTLSKYQLKIFSPRHYSEFTQFIKKEFVSSTKPTNKLVVPKSFSFGIKFDETIDFFKELTTTLYDMSGAVVIDFKNCEKMNIGAATFFQITLLEYFRFTDKINESHYGNIKNEITILKSNKLRINKMLFSLGMIQDFDGIDKTGNSSFLSLRLTTGAKKRVGYRENNKGKIGESIYRFINDSMLGFGYELDEIGKNSMLNLMGEILGNAEDHSKLNNYYVNGVSFMEGDDNPIVELNLAIINLGYSFYEGFISLKEENAEINKKMEDLYLHHKSLPSYDSEKYSKESLFTLYGLQEGISRLKFEDESRGNGTMNFIRAFMNLGQLGEEDKKYKSKLNIISGHTVIECTNDYKPHDREGVYVLSLNKERNIKSLPSKNTIFTHSGYFPGTILQVRIFMSKEFFMKSIPQND